MPEEEIIIADITGIEGNQCDCELENSTDFYPLILGKDTDIFLSTENPDNIKKNAILKYFIDSDIYNERCKPFVTEMTATDYPQLREDEKYFVPYFRMWASQIEDRTFKLACKVTAGCNNCAGAGNIYFEMPTAIKGLTLNPSEGYIENAALESVFTLEFTLSKDVDRNPTDISAVPLKFYVKNKGERTDIGQIHLSVAPKDVFSEAEMTNTIKYFSDGPNKTHKHDCITAVRNGLQKLLGVDLSGAKNYKKYTMYDFMEFANNKGYIIGNPIEVTSKITSGNAVVQTNVEEQINEIISTELGYHLFTISLVDCYHTMTLIIDNRNIQADIPIDIPDQHHMNSSRLNQLNAAMNQLINGYWRQVPTYNTLSKLWKIKNY